MLINDFCKLIFDIREKKVTRSEIARKYPWHRNTLLSYETDRLPDIDYLYALSVETGFDFKILIKLRLQAGILGNLFNFDEINVFNNDLNKSELIEHLVNDNCMAKTILPGAVIHIDTSIKELSEGSIYLFLVGSVLKPCRVQFGIDNSVILNFDNNEFSPINLTEIQFKDIEVKGKVVSVLNPL